MPSYLDFDSTKKFRDFILGKTLKQPNGPQTFGGTTYSVQNTNDMANVTLGGIDGNTPNPNVSQILNVFSPDSLTTVDNINTLPRRANLSLYPYFTSGDYNLVGIAGGQSSYDTESELFKFAAANMQNNNQGPIYSRITQNFEKNTLGRARILDAFNGNTTTAINIITGREPIVEANYRITTESGLSLTGLTVDFLKLVSGTQLPFSQIPGDYLTRPKNPFDNDGQKKERPEAKSEIGRIYQDVTGTLGSMIGINRRPNKDIKPSDLLLDHMGSGQKNRLFDNLNYNRFGPDYTLLARSQNTSKLFNGIGKTIGLLKKATGGTEAPKRSGYIGDDRAGAVETILHDQYDRPYQSSFYLSQFFDAKAAEVFRRSTSISEGGNIAGNLTWVSQNRKTELGKWNKEWSSESTLFEKSMSTNSEYVFAENSILDLTQQMLLQPNQVSAAIDQTTRSFKDGDIKMSRGSAVVYTNKFNKDEAGVEYCRVWTKDRSYGNYSDTMKRTGNIRKFDGSVMGGGSTPWNLNIAPMSNGKKSFDNSTNIKDGNKFGGGFYAKKYMFSIENLAWKTSNRAGFQVNDLPVCERGNNGGRVMWFPPYDLKISEQNNANWDKNSFIGRPEPLYTYLDSERNGTLSFKVVVDHPSILNLLVREHFKGMNDEEADNYINAFFAGCEDLDFYGLIKTYTTLDREDVDLIKAYLDEGVAPEIIESLKFTSTQSVEEKPGSTTTEDKPTDETYYFYFENDKPVKSNVQSKTADVFGNITTTFLSNKTSNVTTLHDSLITLTGQTTANANADKKVIFGITNGITTDNINAVTGQTSAGYDKLQDNYTKYTGTTESLKKALTDKKTDKVQIIIKSATSEVAAVKYNFYLGMRRAYSVLVDFLKKISPLTQFDESIIPWFTDEELKPFVSVGLKLGDGKGDLKIPFKKIGYDIEGDLIIKIITEGENSFVPNFNGDTPIDCQKKLNSTNLAIHAPIAFYCREATVAISFVETNTTVVPPQTVKIPKLKVDPDNKEVGGRAPKKPTIDVMKRIIMKTLSECYYFKKLEEDSPLQFTSLKEKLKYFHPAFHSTTPEGLNSRLTFLLQCLRPGDTIPVKDPTNTTELARNTTFGPPPICVLRIGDFYHSKIIIRDVNFNYDDSPWDMNPEGIGMQPMIATVTMQIAFLGGQGLEKPVEKLQNALSSNFFANTEIYDERSDSTNTMIGGETAEKFTKEFLLDLQKHPEYQLINDMESGKKFQLGKYVGKFASDALNYTELINELYSLSDSYVKSYKDTFYDVLDKFSKKLTRLYFSPDYRLINKVDYFKQASGVAQQISMLGEFNHLLSDFTTLVNAFRTSMLEATDTINICVDILGILDPIADAQYIDQCEHEMKLLVKKIIKEKTDEMLNLSSIKSIESTQNKIVNIIDKLNYVVYYGADGSISGSTDAVIYSEATLDGFAPAIFEGTYDSLLTYLDTCNSNIISQIDNTIDFDDYNNLTTQLLPTEVSKEIYLTFMKDYETEIFYTAVENNGGIDGIDPELYSFFKTQINTVLTITTDIYTIIDIPKSPIRIGNSNIIYDVIETNEMDANPLGIEKGEVLNKIFAEKYALDTSNNTLNYYKK